MSNENKVTSENPTIAENEASSATPAADPAPAADEFQLTIKKLEMPVRPRGVLAE
jgi:hypothetical protein